jgi:hypothetical protein
MDELVQCISKSILLFLLMKNGVMISRDAQSFVESHWSRLIMGLIDNDWEIIMKLLGVESIEIEFLRL